MPTKVESHVNGTPENGNANSAPLLPAVQARKNAKLRLGEMLIQQKLITEEQMEEALASQRKLRRRLGDILVDMGATTEEAIANALHMQLGIGLVDLRGVTIPQNIISLVSGSILRKHTMLPLSFDENDPSTLIVAMSDPLDMAAQDDVSIITNLRVEPRISTAGEINAVLDKHFGNEEAMTAAERYSREREQQIQLMREAAAQVEEESDLDSAPIVQLVRNIVEQAVRQRASDVHIEALEKQVRVRYRIDGVLSEKMVYDNTLQAALITRIKIMSSLDISEKRKPQDGRMTMIVDRTEYDIRVSVLPTSYGEKVVMRLAAASSFSRELSDLGMREWELEEFLHILSNPNGIILVTGPTGSGKSITLYTALSRLNTPEINIVTVEDPVEANIFGINQVQVNQKADLTFANALRSILRQDPDVIMIGEIRDVETAAIAVQASITGHLVVSTVHTNSSAATITRLIDMGIEPFLIADSVVGVIAQRLVRKLCPACRKARQATEAEKRMLLKDVDEDVVIHEPVGCPLCSDIGYYGRIGVYEIMNVTQRLKNIIAAQGTTDEIKTVALEEGMQTLNMSAIKYVLDGTTSIAEMAKVSFEV